MGRLLLPDRQLPLFLFICFLVVVVLCPLLAAQSCQPLSDPTCNSIIPTGTLIFVPAGVDGHQLELVTNRIVNILNQGAVAEPCRSYAIQGLCATNLRPCFTLPNGTALPFPAEPCVDMCWNFYNSCEPVLGRLDSVSLGEGLYFPPGYAAPINCSIDYKDSSFNNGTLYQNGIASIEWEGTNYSVPCSQSEPIDIPALLYCNDPLDYGTNENGVPLCVLPCPLPSLTDEQYDAAKIMQGVLGWLSWVFSAILIISLVVYPKSRDFPRNLVVMTACAANIAAGAIILPTFAGYNNIWCGGDDTTFVPKFQFFGLDENFIPQIEFSFDQTELTATNPSCIFQGAMLQFGFEAAVFWWMIIAFNMCLELYFGRLLSLDKVKWKWVRFVIYLLVGWGIPFILMVIPASAGEVEFSPGETYCFVTNEENYAWSLPFWFIPVGLCLLFGVILFFLALIKMTILFITIKKVKELLLLYLRLSIFILLYLILIVFIFAYTIQYATNESEINSGYEDYYACLILTNGQGCSLSDSITNFDLVMLKGWAISSLGYLLFFNFISIDVTLFWYRLFKTIGLVIFKRQPGELNNLRHMLVSRSGITGRTSLMNSADSLTVTQVEEELDEGFAEEEDEEDDSDGYDEEEEDGSEFQMMPQNKNRSREEETSSSSSSSSG